MGEQSILDAKSSSRTTPLPHINYLQRDKTLKTFQLKRNFAADFCDVEFASLSHLPQV